MFTIYGTFLFVYGSDITKSFPLHIYTANEKKIDTDLIVIGNA